MVSPDELTTIDRDKISEAAVLRILLDEYPEQLTLDELLLQANGAQASSNLEDDLKRAICALERAGLVHRQGLVIWPTRPARYFHWLEVE